jgi:hypothetical protein
MHGTATVRRAAFILGVSSVLAAAPARAIDTPCSALTDAEGAAAVAAARVLFDRRWGRDGPVWLTRYVYKTEPRNPFDLKSVAAAPPGEAPVTGVILATGVTCAAYEIHAPRAYVVRFSADALRFNENNAGWTKPLPKAVILNLGVVKRDAAWVAVDQPEARTAIPPFAILSPVTAGDTAAALKGVNGRKP